MVDGWHSIPGRNRNEGVTEMARQAKKLKVGIVGVGNISGIYLKNLTGVFSNRVDLVGCADMIPERAAKAKEEHKLRKAYKTPEELLADKQIDLF